MSNVWSNDKGLADFIALSHNPDNVVVLVGMSQAQMKTYSSVRYRDYNLIPIQRTHNQYELAMLYSLADVFVNPTYADMFPTVNLESLACGTPVITYRTGGSPEIIDEKTGIVVEPGDINGLAKSIRYLKENPLNAEDCISRVVVHYNKEERFSNYIALYEDLLKENK